jgi:hypothetical protein
MEFETFTEESVDPKQLDLETTNLATKILNHKTSSSIVKRKRTFNEIKDDTKMGLIAERHLIENCGFTRSRNKYGDVVKDGTEYEIKAWRRITDYITNTQLDRLRKGRSQGWYPCEQMIIFEVRDGTYYFNSIYSI